MSALPENVSFDDYVAIDDGVLVCGQLTDDEIIASVQRPEGQEDDSCESDAEEPPPRPSPAEASAALNVLANFATFEDTDGTMWPHIEDMRKFVFAKLFRAVYLKNLTVLELLTKLADLCSLSPFSVHEVYIDGPSGIHVLVTDEVVRNMADESMYILELLRGQDDEGYSLLLKAYGNGRT
ncbi:hypothetical protein HPB47_013474 [Ixodes persulcatus]|uniref:Uncharacterized protein n=1 Tax=Ixodes persulcatus TaxID=34615 RepID=A0AC60QZS9_IXOPE|nr:hypothetical protein HPB47_013474 [Ixodes persulcatus]